MATSNTAQNVKKVLERIIEETISGISPDKLNEVIDHLTSQEVGVCHTNLIIHVGEEHLEMLGSVQRRAVVQAFQNYGPQQSRDIPGSRSSAEYPGGLAHTSTGEQQPAVFQEASTSVRAEETPSRKRTRNDGSDACNSIEAPCHSKAQSNLQMSSTKNEENKLADAALDAIKMCDWIDFQRADLKPTLLSLNEKATLTCPLKCGYLEFCEHTEKRKEFSIVDFTKHFQVCIVKLLMDGLHRCCPGKARKELLQFLIEARVPNRLHNVTLPD